MLPEAIRPEWAAPGAVGALMSTRAGGISLPPWDSLNVGTAVGDAPQAVRHNRATLARALDARPVFLRQVHGVRVLQLEPAHAEPDAPVLEADAAVTDVPGLACTVQVADCLPVLLAARNGGAVGAAHAGWRGLAGGVVDNAVAALCTLAHCGPDGVVAWLGPCIGPQAFEVGADVLQAFGVGDDEAGEGFLFHPRRDGALRWRANLPHLARKRLHALGVMQVDGGTWCTVEQPSRFFSFRRDGVCGRMAASVWLRG
jgi:YfiH family protein